MSRLPVLNIENAHIMFRNFAGRETINPKTGKTINREGDRNFCVLIDDPEQAMRLADDGWNVKILPPRDEEDEARHYIPVAVSFKVIPPKIIMLTRRRKQPLDESTIECLDYAEVRNVDLSLNPSEWEVNGKTGVKAYLKTMYITVEEDEWAEKYAGEEYPSDQ